MQAASFETVQRSEQNTELVNFREKRIECQQVEDKYLDVLKHAKNVFNHYRREPQGCSLITMFRIDSLRHIAYVITLSINMRRHNTLQHPAFLFVAVACLWGGSFVAMNLGLESLPPVLFAAIRYDIASLTLISTALILRKDIRPQSVGDLQLIAVGSVLIISVPSIFLFVGQQYVTSAIAAVIISLTPVLTPVFAYILLADERLGMRGAASTLLGLAGIIVIANPDTATTGQLFGVGLIAASTSVFALGSVLAARYSRSMSMIPLHAWSMAVSAVILHGISYGLVGEPIPQAAVTIDVIAPLVYLGVFASALAYVLYFVLVETVGPNETSLVNYATPVVTAIAGWVLLGDHVTAATLAGFILIMSGFVVLKGRVVLASLTSVPVGGSRSVSQEDDGVVVVNGNAYIVTESGSDSLPTAD